MSGLRWNGIIDLGQIGTLGKTFHGFVVFVISVLGLVLNTGTVAMSSALIEKKMWGSHNGDIYPLPLHTKHFKIKPEVFFFYLCIKQSRYLMALGSDTIWTIPRWEILYLKERDSCHHILTIKVCSLGTTAQWGWVSLPSRLFGLAIVAVGYRRKENQEPGELWAAPCLACIRT